MRIIQRAVLLPLVMIICDTGQVVADQVDPLHRSMSREIRDNYRRKSDEYVAKNLYRFALDRLWVYDQLLDSLYERELNDTLAFFEREYSTSSGSKMASIAGLKKEIAINENERAELDERFSTLLRYTMFSFLIWLALVFAFIVFRRRRMKKTESVYNTSAGQLESLEELSEKANRLFEEFTSNKTRIQKLDEDIANLEAEVEAKRINSQDNPEFPALVTRTEKLRKAIDAEKRIIDSVLSQSSSEEEKVTVDINALCDAYMEIAFRGTEQSESFSCQVTRDFEKKLPGVQMNPSAVGTLLLNVLSNAFESVKEKSELGIKGYQPKVSISTRILPKFLQVRIKDNGTGMNDQLLQNAGTEFLTTRTITPRPGLGLSIARSIIEEHKGEIKIESEEGNSTDVYIKFYLQ